MSVYKKNGTWCVRVYYTDLSGKKKEKKRIGFHSKKEALEMEKNLYLRTDNLQENAIDDMKFSDLYNVYIKNKRQTLKPKSFMTLESIFINHILPYFGNYKVAKITNNDYINWKDYILNKGFSYKYNSSIHICMVNILNYAINFYGLEKNIASKVGNFASNNYIPKVDFWTVNEFQRFISFADDIVYKTLFTLLFNTGLRIGEALALNWNDINNDILNIDKTLTRSKENNYLINTPKTFSSIRKIKLDKTTLSMLNDLKKQNERIVCFSNNWFIFGGVEPLPRTTIASKKNLYCKLAGVKQIRIHDFRHSHASFLISKGIPLTAVSKRLGHKDVYTTLNKYSHFILEDETRAIQVIDDCYRKN